MIASNADALLRKPDSPVSGNLAGDVTMVEFFDYNCPYCRSVAQTLDRVMESDGSIRMVFKEFPILGSNSIFAAKAALAANAQRSEEHTSELQSLMRISYAVFCLKKKNRTKLDTKTHQDDKNILKDLK